MGKLKGNKKSRVYKKKRLPVSRKRPHALTVDGVIAPYVFTRMRWCTKNVILPAATTAPGLVTVDLSNLFMPDYASIWGSGEQPLGWDQMSALYGLYCIYGAKVTISVLTPTVHTVIALSYGITATAYYSKIHDVIEDTNTRKKTICIGDDRVNKLSHYFNIPKIKGVSKTAFMSEDNNNAMVSSTTGSVNGAYCNILYQCTDETTSIAPRVQVEVDFYVRWNRSQRLASS